MGDLKNIMRPGAIMSLSGILEEKKQMVIDAYEKEGLTLIEEIKQDMTDSEKLLFSFMNSKTEEYKEKNDIRRIVIDYISGQTDKFFLKECKKNLKEFKI